MKLLCKKYNWQESIDLKDVNLFNDNKELVWTEDLYPFSVDKSIGDIRNDFEKIDNTTDTLYKTASTFRFDVENISEFDSGYTLQHFFEIYYKNPRIRFVLEVYDDDNDKIYEGVIYKQNIKFPDRDEEKIKITVVGYEQEFKDLLVNQKLQPLPGNGPNWSLNGFASTDFIGMLNHNLPSNITNNMDIDSFVSSHYIAHNPYLYASHGSFTRNTMVIKTGYNCYLRDDIDFYTFFNSLLLSKGWIYYFHNSTLVIQQRANTNYDVLELDCDNVDIKHDIESQVQELLVENVIINDGEFYSNGNLLSPTDQDGYQQYIGGKRHVVFSETAYDTCHSNNSLNPFLYLKRLTTSYMIKYDNHKTMIRLDEDRWNHNFAEYHIWHPMPTITKQIYGYGNGRTLFIDPYINTKNNAGGIDINNANNSGGIFYGNGNFYSTDLALGNNDFRYIGSPGDSLFRIAGTNSVKVHQDDINTIDFRTNFSGFLRSNTQIMFNYDVDYKITDPRKRIKFKNYEHHDIADKLFAIRGLSFHPERETSKLKLQMV